MGAPETGAPPESQPGAEPDFEMIELMFFAYRDFVGEADRVLAAYGFGRAHHRVLHFVNRNPGLTIAALLDILGITKQSLARVLKELVDSGFISQESGQADRRQRLLRATPKGLDLAAALAARQSARIGHALSAMPAGQREAARAFLLGLIDPARRREVLALAGARRGGRS